MKQTLLITLALMFVASLAFAQLMEEGSIGIYRDLNTWQGCSCCLSDATYGITVYYIVHWNYAGAKKSIYAAPKPECFTAIYLADINQFPTVGNSQTGVTVDYGGCLTSTIHTQTLIFFTQGGTTPTCCRWSVVPHPEAASGKIEVLDCNDQTVYAHGETSIINVTRYCESGCCGWPTPVEDTTWGRVKSLYSE